MCVIVTLCQFQVHCVLLFVTVIMLVVSNGADDITIASSLVTTVSVSEPVTLFRCL